MMRNNSSEWLLRAMSESPKYDTPQLLLRALFMFHNLSHSMRLRFLEAPYSKQTKINKFKELKKKRKDSKSFKPIAEQNLI